MKLTCRKFWPCAAKQTVVSKDSAADACLRRSGLLKKQLNWKQFGAKLVKRFSAQGSYDPTEQFNSIKQNTSTVAEYNKLFEDLMAEVQEENPDQTIQTPNINRCLSVSKRD